MWRRVSKPISPSIVTPDVMLEACNQILAPYHLNNLLALRAYSLIKRAVDTGMKITKELGQVAAILALKMEIDLAPGLSVIGELWYNTELYVQLDRQLFDVVFLRPEGQPRYLLELIDSEILANIDWVKLNTVAGDHLYSYYQGDDPQLLLDEMIKAHYQLDTPQEPEIKISDILTPVTQFSLSSLLIPPP